MRLVESTDSVLEYRLRITWRVVLLVVGLAVLVPITVMAFAEGGNLDRLPPQLSALFPFAFLASAFGLMATVSMAFPAKRRRVERRTTGDLVIDVEEPALARGRGRTGASHGAVRFQTIEVSARQVWRVVVERIPAASGVATPHDRYRVAIDLFDGRSVYPWWGFVRGAAGQAFVRDAAARMHALMRLGGEVFERDTVRISTFDAAAFARGGAAAAAVEAEWADRADPLNPVHTLAQRALAVSVDTAICVAALAILAWLMRSRPDLYVLLVLPQYGTIRLAYHTLWEGSSGTTLGKRLARLRVVSVDGAPISYGQAFKRNLARVVDAIAFYLVALVVAAQPGPNRSQRIGDRWAGTIVVDERRIEATLAARRARA